MSSIDDLINLCWKRTTRDTPIEYIYVTQTLGFIRELELVLGIASMLQDHELLILKLMMDKSPLMKLHKKEVKEFILRLVQFENFSDFLAKLGVTMLDLDRALNLPIRKPLSPYNRRINERTDRSDIKTEPLSDLRESRPFSTGSRPYADIKPFTDKPFTDKPFTDKPFTDKPFTNTRPFTDTRPNPSTLNKPASTFSRQTISRPDSAQLQTDLAIKQKHITERDIEIQQISSENRQLVSTTTTQNRKIVNLQNEITNLNSYVKNLEDQLTHRSNGNVQQLLKKVYERDSTIKSLEQLCSEYQTELEKYEKNDQNNEPIVQELIESITKQDVLIESLKKKLVLDESGSKDRLKEFMINLPFLKQYYMFYKYKQENSNWGNLVMNAITLMFSSFMVVNFFKLVLYMGTWIATYHSTELFTYDDYGTGWFSTQSTFVWWKEIEWIEYAVYYLRDWGQ
jgi:hypothetical protein